MSFPVVQVCVLFISQRCFPQTDLLLPWTKTLVRIVKRHCSLHFSTILSESSKHNIRSTPCCDCVMLRQNCTLSPSPSNLHHPLPPLKLTNFTVHCNGHSGTFVLEPLNTTFLENSPTISKRCVTWMETLQIWELQPNLTWLNSTNFRSMCFSAWSNSICRSVAPLAKRLDNISELKEAPVLGKCGAVGFELYW